MTAPSAQVAVDRANNYSSYSHGMCLQWVRGPCWDIPSHFGSAIEAWNGARHKHPGDRNPPLGAALFYRGGNYGHVVIARADDMRSTDCPTTGRVSAAAIDWPERAWGFTYLGWTEDLNGVMLPLDTDTTDPGGDDDMPQYDHAAIKAGRTIPADQWIDLDWEAVSAGDAFDVGEKGATLGGRRYDAVLSASITAPEGSMIRLRTVEVADGAIAEQNPQSEHTATAGGTYVIHPWVGKVADGRRLRFQVKCVKGGTLDAAQVAVLSW